MRELCHLKAKEGSKSRHTNHTNTILITFVFNKHILINTKYNYSESNNTNMHLQNRSRHNYGTAWHGITSANEPIGHLSQKRNNTS
jgi:hypothetical protein